MSEETPQETPSRRALVTAVLEDLEAAIGSAAGKLEEIGDSVTTKQLGQLYLAPTSEGGGGFYISSLWGEVDLEDGWYLSFDELAEKLAEGTDTTDSLEAMIEGLKKVTSVLEKEREEDLRMRAEGKKPV